MKRVILLVGLAGLILVTGACANKDVIKKQDQEILSLKDDVAALKARQEQLEGAVVASHKETVRSEEPTRMKAEARPEAGHQAGEAVAHKGEHHLRVVSLPVSEANKKEAEGVAKYLNEHGVENAVARLSHGKTSHWVVDAGSFASADDKAAVALKQKVKALKYQGHQFKDAHFVAY